MVRMVVAKETSWIGRLGEYVCVCQKSFSVLFLLWRQFVSSTKVLKVRISRDAAYQMLIIHLISDSFVNIKELKNWHEFIHPSLCTISLWYSANCAYRATSTSVYYTVSHSHVGLRQTTLTEHLEYLLLGI